MAEKENYLSSVREQDNSTCPIFCSLKIHRSFWNGEIKLSQTVVTTLTDYTSCLPYFLTRLIVSPSDECHWILSNRNQSEVIFLFCDTNSLNFLFGHYTRNFQSVGYRISGSQKYRMVIAMIFQEFWKSYITMRNVYIENNQKWKVEKKFLKCKI